MIYNLLRKNNPSYFFANHKLTLIRNGETIWNKDKKWVGWLDIPLSSFGINQIKQCATLLKNKDQKFDVIYTSVLSRAIKSTNYILDTLNIHYVPVYKDWRLNEKHYGALQGQSKVQMNEKHGEKVVTQWRTSINVPPPPLDRNHQTHPSKNRIYQHIEPALLPNSECLSDIMKRLKPLWQQQISKDIKRGKNTLVLAHGSSLRALIYTLMPHLTEQQIKNFNIPNAVPIILDLDDNMQVNKIEYLGDQSEISVKINKIKFQTKKTDV